MAKYIKKPVAVEATQWNFGDPPLEGMIAYSDVVLGHLKEIPTFKGFYYIETLEGDHRVSDGDYIITGIQGEKYPCKPDIFEATYYTEEEYAKLPIA